MPRRIARYKPRIWVYVHEADAPTSPVLAIDKNLQAIQCTRISLERSKDGDLSMLRNMPLDILYEIFSHLHPLDVLHLSRTSRRLRKILMSPSSLSVWQTALSNIEGLPSCPTDLTEPQFASLAFDKHCHFCLARNIRDVFWSCRVRSCKKCVHKYFISEYTLRRMLPEVLDIHRCEAIFPYIVYLKPGRNRPGQILYHLPVAEAYIRDLEEVVLSLPDEALSAWSKQKSLEQLQRLQHARLCESWSTRWGYRRPEEFNVTIVVALLALLMFLWRDTVLQF